MKYTINYGNGAGTFPQDALDVIKRAGAADLKVFLCLCAGGGDADIKRLSELTGCDEEDVRDALAFWRGTGLIEAGCDKKSAEKKRVAEVKEAKQTQGELEMPKKLRAADELPSYTSDQLSNILEKRQEIVTLIDECQNIMGKVFNVKEINVIIGLVDYLELEFEYIVILMSHCVSQGKKTLHYVEKTAFGLYDSGICTAEQLMAELERRERAAAIEGKIRSLFGLGSRAFTSKEKKHISAWVGEFGYGIDIIQKAYEVTADATGTASIPYANSVIERWNAEGLRTLEDIERSYQKKAESKPHEGSFDTDDFFEAAVRRSLGEN